MIDEIMGCITMKEAITEDTRDFDNDEIEATEERINRIENYLDTKNFAQQEGVRQRKSSRL